ncbi:MAG: hypothetical protein ACYTBJ_06175 [Planctomycetota bacterium]|jgi:hypothetical protein
MAAEVTKLYGGSGLLPAGWDATSIGNVCTIMDAILDGKASPSTLGTGTNEAAFADYCVYTYIEYQQKKTDRSNPSESWWTHEHEDWLQRLLTSTTTDSIGYIKGQDTS